MLSKWINDLFEKSAILTELTPKGYQSLTKHSQYYDANLFLSLCQKGITAIQKEVMYNLKLWTFTNKLVILHTRIKNNQSTKEIS